MILIIQDDSHLLRPDQPIHIAQVYGVGGGENPALVAFGSVSRSGITSWTLRMTPDQILELRLINKDELNDAIKRQPATFTSADGLDRDR